MVRLLGKRDSSGADCAELQGRFCVGVDTLTEVGSILRKHDVPELSRLSSSQSTAKLFVERRLVYIDDNRPGSDVEDPNAS